MIDIHNLTRTFGDVLAVDGLYLSIEKGTIFGFLGPNGAGKTTTIRILCCLLKPTEGTATVAGYDIMHKPLEVKKIIGYLPENPSFYKEKTAEEVLDYFGRLQGIPARERKERIREVLELVKLEDRKSDKTGTFSRGMEQRLGFAQALLGNPEVLFLDEPASSLDPKGIRETRDLVKELGKQEITIFLSSHRLNEVSLVCNKAAIINKGRLVACDSLENLRQKVTPKRMIKISLVELKPKIIKTVERFSDVEKVEREGNKLVVVLSADVNLDVVEPEIVEAIIKNGGRIRTVSIAEPDLEDVFLRILEAEDD